MTGRSISGPAASSQASVFHLGGAFGELVARGLTSREVASFDELHAPFHRPLGGYFRHRGTAALGLE